MALAATDSVAPTGLRGRRGRPSGGHGRRDRNRMIQAGSEEHPLTPQKLSRLVRVFQPSIRRLQGTVLGDGTPATGNEP